MRSLFLAVTLITAYAYLREWPADLHPPILKVCFAVGLHPVLRSCLAVLVLVLGIGLWRKRERPACSEAPPVRPPRWPDYLAVGMGVLAIECLFLFFLSAAPPKAESLAYRLEAALRSEHAATRPQASDPADGTQGGTISGNWLWDDQGKRRLPLRTNARPSNKPEVFLRSGDRQTTGHLLRRRPYIRAFAMERFEDSTWSSPAMEAETLAPDEAGWVDLPEPSSRPGPLLRGEIFHSAHPGGQNVFTALQGATRTRLPQLRKVAPGIYRLNPPRDPGQGYNYEVVAKTVTFTSLLESGALDAFLVPDELPEHLVELPADEDLRQALIDVAIKTQGPIESRLLSLRKFLQRNYQYSLEVANPDQLDPLLNFLLHEKRGHCEFFATAGALLCRALDIPARVAYGWTGGRYFGTQDLFMFRAREAHAWTEVYLKDVGWIVFDTTPASVLAARNSVALPDEKPPLDEDGIPDFTTPGSDGGGFAGWTFVALGIGLALLVLAAVILRFRKRPVSLSGAASTAILPAPPGYLARFRQACRRLGHPMPTGRTLRQQLAALATEEKAPAFAGELLDYHYATTYGEARPDKSREAALVRAIRKWS